MMVEPMIISPFYNLSEIFYSSWFNNTNQTQTTLSNNQDHLGKVRRMIGKSLHNRSDTPVSLSITVNNDKIDLMNAILVICFIVMLLCIFILVLLCYKRRRIIQTHVKPSKEATNRNNEHQSNLKDSPIEQQDMLYNLHPILNKHGNNNNNDDSDLFYSTSYSFP